MHWKRVVTLELDAGEHDLELTLPPKAALDQVVIQRREGDINEYLNVVSDEGFKLGPPNRTVRRREAIAAARRLRNRFDSKKQFRCEDALVALEQAAFLRMAALRSDREQGVELAVATGFPATDPGSGGSGGGTNAFPKAPGLPPSASPITPDSE